MTLILCYTILIETQIGWIGLYIIKIYCWEGSDVMIIERQQLLKLINEIPEKQIPVPFTDLTSSKVLRAYA